MNFSFIFIGSTHGFTDDFLKQEEVINAIRPEFVLSEELENIKLESEEEFKGFFKKRHISNMTSFDEVEKLINFCFNKKVKLIGIDLQNFGFADNLQKKIRNQEELTSEEEKELNKIIKLREEHHLSKILEYKEKTNKPLVVILGCWHLREGSFLRRNLENYKIVAPLGKQGRILLSPDKSNEIKYGEIISDDTKIKD